MRTLLGLVVVAMAALEAHALSDDFEDGEYTTNPGWTVTNPYGQASVVADPVRPGNLVLSGHGSDQAFHVLSTFDIDLPWTGFHACEEFLTSAGSQYGALLGVYITGYPDWPLPGVAVMLMYDETWTSTPDAILRVKQFSETGSVEHDIHLDPGQVPINEWLRLSLWHDSLAGLIRADLRRVSDDALIAESSVSPISDLAAQSPIAMVTIGIAELTWQYLDNVSVTPEPTILSLPLDIMPSDCPNLFTPDKKGKGRLPMAILGSEDVAAAEIDVDSISIGDVVFLVKVPSADKDENGDGINDLMLHFSRRDVIDALALDMLEPGTVAPITVTGYLLDGRPFEATDCVTIVALED